MSTRGLEVLDRARDVAAHLEQAGEVQPQRAQHARVAGFLAGDEPRLVELARLVGAVVTLERKAETRERHRLGARRLRLARALHSAGQEGPRFVVTAQERERRALERQRFRAEAGLVVDDRFDDLERLRVVRDAHVRSRQIQAPGCAQRPCRLRASRRSSTAKQLLERLRSVTQPHREARAGHDHGEPVRVRDRVERDACVVVASLVQEVLRAQERIARHFGAISGVAREHALEVCRRRDGFAARWRAPRAGARRGDAPQASTMRWSIDAESDGTARCTRVLAAVSSSGGTLKTAASAPNVASPTATTRAPASRARCTRARQSASRSSASSTSTMRPSLACAASSASTASQDWRRDPSIQATGMPCTLRATTPLGASSAVRPEPGRPDDAQHLATAAASRWLRGAGSPSCRCRPRARPPRRSPGRLQSRQTRGVAQRARELVRGRVAVARLVAGRSLGNFRQARVLVRAEALGELDALRERDTERVDLRAHGERLALEQLGRGVARGQPLGLGARVLPRRGEPEIDQRRATAALDDDVRGLDVTVEQTRTVQQRELLGGARQRVEHATRSPARVRSGPAGSRPRRARAP